MSVQYAYLLPGTSNPAHCFGTLLDELRARRILKESEQRRGFLHLGLNCDFGGASFHVKGVYQGLKFLGRQMSSNRSAVASVSLWDRLEYVTTRYSTKGQCSLQTS